MLLPDLKYLKAIDAGDIRVRVKTDPNKGTRFEVTLGAYLLRLHEEAGYVERMLTSRWAGYPAHAYTKGMTPKLTKAGKAALYASA